MRWVPVQLWRILSIWVWLMVDSLLHDIMIQRQTYLQKGLSQLQKEEKTWKFSIGQFFLGYLLDSSWFSLRPSGMVCWPPAIALRFRIGFANENMARQKAPARLPWSQGSLASFAFTLNMTWGRCLSRLWISQIAFSYLWPCDHSIAS
jgi:hypothetical protein